jgi:CTP:molybdopterin cytidylyltransferase MocA/xanthine/CO dehydrogenase XdhC/CoxF family maturation factor
MRDPAPEGLLAVAARLSSQGEAFALITVVRATAPTSGKPGDKAILTGRGEWLGWVGGSCAEPTARRAATQALRDGRCRLIHLTNDEADFVRSGVEVAAMTCHSGGSLEIYVEPHLPEPWLIVFGRSPIARATCDLGALLRHRVIAADLQPDAPTVAGAALAQPAEENPAAASSAGAGRAVPRVRQLAELDALAGPRRVVVASHGQRELEALVWAFQSGASYVGLVTSQRRLTDVLAGLRERGVSDEALARLHAPAGLSIGATGPEEVALSVLGEIVAESHAPERVAGAPLGSSARAPSAGVPASSAAASTTSSTTTSSTTTPASSAVPLPARAAPAPSARRSCCDEAEPAAAVPRAPLAGEAAAPPAPARAALAGTGSSCCGGGDEGSSPARAASGSASGGGSVEVTGSRISAVVLAAGLSRRMGAQNKLLLPLDGKPIVRRVIESVLGAALAEVVVVLGHQAPEVMSAIAGLGVRTVHNPDFASGQVSSVRAGLGALERPTDAVMVCLGDQPLVTSADLLALRRAYTQRPHGSILVPVRGAQRGNPVILDWGSARETLERGTNFGCRHFMDENPDRVYRWPAYNDHFVRDVDEPADYQTLLVRPEV